MNLTDPILILGAGESGVGSALLAKSLGARAFVSDAGDGKGPGVNGARSRGHRLRNRVAINLDRLGRHRRGGEKPRHS